MKEFRFFTGGHERRVDDLGFVQGALAEAIAGLTSTYGLGADEGFILSGCEQTPAGPALVDVAAGFFVLEGEVCVVDAHQYTTLIGTPHWVIEESFDPAGNRDYLNSVNHDTFVIRKARIRVLSPPAVFTPGDAPTITELIAQNVFALQDATTNTVMINSWTSPVASYTRARYYKDLDGRVYLEGSADGTGGSSPIMFNLPVGYRPTDIKAFAIATLGTVGVATLFILPTGDVLIDAGSGTFNDTFAFDGVGGFVGG